MVVYMLQKGAVGIEPEYCSSLSVTCVEEFTAYSKVTPICSNNEESGVPLQFIDWFEEQNVSTVEAEISDEGSEITFRLEYFKRWAG